MEVGFGFVRSCVLVWTRIPPHVGRPTLSQQGSEPFFRSSRVFGLRLFERLTYFAGKRQAVAADCVSLLRRSRGCKQTEQQGGGGGQATGPKLGQALKPGPFS